MIAGSLLLGGFAVWKLPREDEPDAARIAGTWSCIATNSEGARHYVKWELAADGELGEAFPEVVLVVGASLFVRTLVNLRTVDAGFDRAHVVILRLDPSERATPSDIKALVPLEQVLPVDAEHEAARVGEASELALFGMVSGSAGAFFSFVGRNLPTGPFMVLAAAAWPVARNQTPQAPTGNLSRPAGTRPGALAPAGRPAPRPSPRRAPTRSTRSTRTPLPTPRA